jgi:hypothetical protein
MSSALGRLRKVSPQLGQDRTDSGKVSRAHFGQVTLGSGTFKIPVASRFVVWAAALTTSDQLSDFTETRTPPRANQTERGSDSGLCLLTIPKAAKSLDLVDFLQLTTMRLIHLLPILRY